MGGFVRTVAFILPNFQAGGAERVMITVANHIDRARFRPIIIVFGGHGALRGLVAADVPVIDLATRLHRGVPALARAVRAQGADVAISTMAHLNIFVLLARPLMGGVPVIVREAVTPGFFAGSPLKNLILRAAYIGLYPFAARILSPTQAVFDEMPAILRNCPGKTQRIFNPVDADAIRTVADPALRAQWAAPGQRLFLAAGRLVAQKGFDRLIGALRDWRDRDDWRLVILGEGPDHDALRHQIDLHGLHQITLAGFEAQPWRYFAAADAFLLPSRYEGLPNVALEALAMGAPVIAADSAGGIAEITAEAAAGAVTIVPDMTTFAAAMDRVGADTGSWPRASLLPPCFARGTVVAAYESAFDAVIAAKARG